MLIITKKSGYLSGDVALHILDGPAGIDDGKAFRKLFCQREVALPDKSVKCELFVVHAIATAALPGPCHTDFSRCIQQQGQIGLDSVLHPFCEHLDALQRQAAATALVGTAGIGETVAHDPFTLLEGRQDGIAEMQATGGKKQQ